jgi:hypothetical protein
VFPFFLTTPSDTETQHGEIMKMSGVGCNVLTRTKKHNDKGQKMRKETDSRGEFAFEVVDRMVGGAKAYWVSEQTVAMVWSECQSNETLKRLAGMYLVGSSERAEGNLAKLKAELVSVFGIDLGKVA